MYHNVPLYSVVTYNHVCQLGSNPRVHASFWRGGGATSHSGRYAGVCSSEENEAYNQRHVAQTLRKLMSVFIF